MNQPDIDTIEACEKAAKTFAALAVDYEVIGNHAEAKRVSEAATFCREWAQRIRESYDD